jgi:hypothetical protein
VLAAADTPQSYLSLNQQRIENKSFVFYYWSTPAAPVLQDFIHLIDNA